MARSLALGLYLLSRRGNGNGASAHARETRPSGRLYWFHLSEGVQLSGPAEIARVVARDDPEASFLLTVDGVAEPDLSSWPDDTVADAPPGEQRAELLAFLAHWRPTQLVLFSGELPPALIVTASDHALPMVLVSPGMSRTSAMSWRWRPAMARSLLGRFTRIVAPDDVSADRLMSLSGGHVPVDIAGTIEETCDPPPSAEAEREALARILRARPVWLAAGCPAVEDEAIVSAHAYALRYAHRGLLVLVPDDPSRAAALAERLDAQGWSVALRSRDEDPDEHIQIVIADTEGEFGLWYRLSPVTFLGGSLLGSGPARNPLEAAVLGSAIVTGPQTAPYADIYARLSQARAVRLVRTAASLAEAIAELNAPDRAAILAHNAWAAATGGAEVAARIAQTILAALPAAPAPVAQG